MQVHHSSISSSQHNNTKVKEKITIKPFIMANLDQEFKKAVDFMNSLPKDGIYVPPMEERLRLYGWFKFATAGPCTANKPEGSDEMAKNKWEAWKESSKLSKVEAQIKYIELYKKIHSTWLSKQ